MSIIRATELPKANTPAFEVAQRLLARGVDWSVDVRPGLLDTYQLIRNGHVYVTWSYSPAQKNRELPYLPDYLYFVQRDDDGTDNITPFPEPTEVDIDNLVHKLLSL